MSTTTSSVSPSTINSDSGKYVIPHLVADANPGKTALEAGSARNAYQHQLVQVSKGMGGGDKKNKNKKSKKHNRKSAIKKQFSKKFRRSILRKKSRRMRLHKKYKKASFHGGSNASGGDKLIIPSFRQASPTGTGIINQLAGNHAQTLSYSAYDDQVTKPVS